MCYWGWRFPYYYNGGFWGMPLMMILSGIIWIVVIFAIIYVIRHFLKEKDHNNKEELLNTLKIRLAKGEITSEEFEKLKKILGL